MIVSFETKKVVEWVPITPEMKQYYENLFAVLAHRMEAPNACINGYGVD